MWLIVMVSGPQVTWRVGIYIHIAGSRRLIAPCQVLIGWMEGVFLSSHSREALTSETQEDSAAGAFSAVRRGHATEAKAALCNRSPNSSPQIRLDSAVG